MLLERLLAWSGHAPVSTSQTVLRVRVRIMFRPASAPGPTFAAMLTPAPGTTTSGMSTPAHGPTPSGMLTPALAPGETNKRC